MGRVDSDCLGGIDLAGIRVEVPAIGLLSISRGFPSIFITSLAVVTVLVWARFREVGLNWSADTERKAVYTIGCRKFSCNGPSIWKSPSLVVISKVPYGLAGEASVEGGILLRCLSRMSTNY